MRGDVVGDRQQFERGERTEDHIDVVALDQFLRLGLGARGIAAGVADHQLDLAAGQHVVAILQEQIGALLHLDAALRQRTGLHREQADADRLVLRDGRHRQSSGSGSREECTATKLGMHVVASSHARLSGLVHS